MNEIETMLVSALSFGERIKDLVLLVASLLRDEGAAGIVVLVLGLAAVMVWALARTAFWKRTGTVKRFRKKVEDLGDQSLVQGRDQIAHWLDQSSKSAADRALAEAWAEFDETLVVDDRHDPPVLRNSVRPSVFFNVDDLHFGAGFYRIVPGLFVSIGLALTFLGLIAALQQMSGDKIDDAAMADLLRIASAKFIMSLSGLVCSILLTISLRKMTGRLDSELHGLCRALERKMEFASLERIGLEQLKAMEEDREHHRRLMAELIAEIGGPLRTELPQAMVILPVLTGCDRRTHAAIFSFMAGVTPPMPMLGRSLL